MKITKEKLNLENGLQQEWLITNGIGGYSSSTIIGANTRRYHGLLIAPLVPPAGRNLILSKLDESIEFKGEQYPLFTNVCTNNISTGYKYQEKFERNYIPIFTYKVGKTQITKMISLKYGENTVGVYYKIINGNAKDKVKLTLSPVLNCRDFHSLNTNYDYTITQEISNLKVKTILNNHINIPIYMNVSEGKYIKHDKDIFKNMFYIEEEKRGFYPEENHIVPGKYEIEINPKEEKEISFICSLEEDIEKQNVHEFIRNERDRIEELFEQSNLISDIIVEEKNIDKDLIKTLIVASDNFVVKRSNTELHTILAGYPWFLDWGRDTLIAFEGLLLVTKRFEIAREILKTSVKDFCYGLIPNGYSEYTNKPLYNSVDAALLLFEQVQKYIDYTGDYKFIKKHIFHRLEEIIEFFGKGITLDGNNIFLDTDGLISAGSENTQNTWMDAKFEGKAVTPRNGKAVEINALWYNANRIMEKLSFKIGDILKVHHYKVLADKCKENFKLKFYNEKNKCLDDVVGDSKIRPNQLFAISLSNPVIASDEEEFEKILNTVKRKLLNSYGLKTLSKDSKEYIEKYEGGPEQRDNSYHQGITWTWLLGIYYDSLKKIKDKEKRDRQLSKFIKDVEKTFKEELFANGCIGSIAEIYDSCEPQLPKGTIAQAWSVSEVLRIIAKK